jgi:aminobenzoyl-glutamate utilization protein B
MTDYAKIEKEVDAQAELIWDMAYNVWKFAELGLEEEQSSAYESAALEKNGFKISDRGIGGCDTSWIATWGTGSPVLGILVEFDALPDLGNEPVPTKTPRKDGVTNGHGCGHNLIGSGAIGAAIALKTHMENEKIAGTLKVFGCPAEEMIAGKNFMARAGAFKGLDACLHSHPGMVNAAWNFHAAGLQDLTLEWAGRTAHAGATPWEGRSSLHAAEIFLVAVNMMREQILPTARMHYYIEDGGHAVNVIPDYAKVQFRYRGPHADNIRQNIAWVKDIAKGAALSTQTKETVTVIGGCLDCLPNDTLANRITDHLKRHFPIQYTEEEQAFAKSIQKEMGKPEDGMPDTVMPVPTGVEVGGSTDVADVSWSVPTMGFMYSAWPQHIAPHQWGCTACHGMSIGQKSVVQASHVLAAMGLDLLTQPDLLKAAKAEFEKLTEGKPADSLCESDAPPHGTLKNRHQYECVIHAAMEHFGIKEDIS